jgi:uncharacterized protein (DUF2252 family)
MKHSRQSFALEEIVRFNRSFKKRLRRLKFARMDMGAFQFFRGTDHLFASYWEKLKPADAGPPLLTCGDLHLENFGGYRADNGDFYFDINDFDEAVVAPCSFDLVRCTTSILLAAGQWQLSPRVTTELATAYLNQFRTTVKQATAAQPIHPSTRWDAVAADLLGPTALATQQQLLEHETSEKKSGRRSIVRSKQKHPDIRPQRAAAVRKAVEGYGRRIGRAAEYRTLDVAGRIAGIGSLGVRRYTVLVEGSGPPWGYRLLDVKEARPSSILTCARGPQLHDRRDDARRVVAAQKHLQAEPTANLDVLHIGRRGFRMREMIPDENRSRIDRFEKEESKLHRAVQLAGRLTAISQLRGSRVNGHDCQAGLKHWAAGPALDEVLAAATRYVGRMCCDYEAFHRACQRCGPGLGV